MTTSRSPTSPTAAFRSSPWSAARIFSSASSPYLSLGAGRATRSSKQTTRKRRLWPKVIHQTSGSCLKRITFSSVRRAWTGSSNWCSQHTSRHIQVFERKLRSGCNCLKSKPVSTSVLGGCDTLSSPLLQPAAELLRAFVKKCKLVSAPFDWRMRCPKF